MSPRASIGGTKREVASLVAAAVIGCLLLSVVDAVVAIIGVVLVGHTSTGRVGASIRSHTGATRPPFF